MSRMLLSATLFLVGASVPAVAASDEAASTKSLEREKQAVLRVEKLVANAPTPELGLSCFDADALQDDFFAPQRRGVAQIRQDFGVYMQNYTTFHADILDMTIELQGGLAVAYSHQRFTAKGRGGQTDLDAVIRQTDVLKKKHGKWLITYQHLSVPIDIHTGKAVYRP